MGGYENDDDECSVDESMARVDGSVFGLIL